MLDEYYLLKTGTQTASLTSLILKINNANDVDKVSLILTPSSGENILIFPNENEVKYSSNLLESIIKERKPFPDITNILIKIDTITDQ